VLICWNGTESRLLVSAPASTATRAALVSPSGVMTCVAAATLVAPSERATPAHTSIAGMVRASERRCKTLDT
jgi:hypothetical protein